MIKREIIQIYPESGTVQVAYGRVNGAWTVWFIHAGDPDKGTHFPTSDEYRSQFMFNDLCQVLKTQYYLEGKSSNGS